MNRMSETKSRRAALVLLLCSGVLWPACSAEGDGNDGGLDAGTDTSDGDAGTDDETTDDTEGAMPVVDPDRILADITWLADAERGGRKAGTPGNAAAVDWAEQRMMDLGLEAAGEVDFRQEVSFAGWEVGGEATVGIDDSILVPGEDYEILQYSGAADVTGELVFVGHGLTIPPYQKLQHPLCPVDETTGWDDYAGIDVTGKIVVVLRHGPGDNQSWHNYCVPQAELQDGAAPVLWNFAYKAANARLHGAKAMIVVQDYYHENEHVSGVTLDVAGFLDDFASVSVDRDLVTAALPDLHVTAAFGNDLLLRDFINPA